MIATQDRSIGSSVVVANYRETAPADAVLNQLNAHDAVTADQLATLIGQPRRAVVNTLNRLLDREIVRRHTFDQTDDSQRPVAYWSLAT